MNYNKQYAIDLLDELHGDISYDTYCSIRDGLDYIETLEERDTELEWLWEQFEDIPMNPETERIEEPFLEFPKGTLKDDIWHWFDDRHSRGIVFLLYEYTPIHKKKKSEDSVKWDVYIRYLYLWADTHRDKSYIGMSPVCYDEWCENEYYKRIEGGYL